MSEEKKVCKGAPKFDPEYPFSKRTTDHCIRVNCGVVYRQEVEWCLEHFQFYDEKNVLKEYYFYAGPFLKSTAIAPSRYAEETPTARLEKLEEQVDKIKRRRFWFF